MLVSEENFTAHLHARWSVDEPPYYEYDIFRSYTPEEGDIPDVAINFTRPQSYYLSRFRNKDDFNNDYGYRMRPPGRCAKFALFRFHETNGFGDRKMEDRSEIIAIESWNTASVSEENVFQAIESYETSSNRIILPYKCHISS